MWIYRDTGIGMTCQEIVDCLGTIAQSGSTKFLKALEDIKDARADSNLIVHFGVGFYSAFLVSERVEVSTKSPKSDKQYVWEGVGGLILAPIAFKRRLIQDIASLICCAYLLKLSHSYFLLTWSLKAYTKAPVLRWERNPYWYILQFCCYINLAP
ncbi:unnamed protein product [Cuscuta campestris]|uniref:Histidine kinase/HSP90-like ATPase domain-containing protein n=1 Tax=Cuscuta campestris TaxID=132261 RepID=A0A484M6A3_9ASTE|nr:unnamed protein product [Cuscuta campestris]